ncbi:hypothetical protein SEMRO_320_G116390.1 [Seminavis robusta]|uniref:Uncharacterized protein n=1 Tax=Seminavis robusta TaxID=568900 RepID=A0A9N8DXG7_9STRA|nr:hypothetical protein SEMRO_320_G116390.1 [Seminavis robusta]|eukprot:Sro320_g116390.1 n/a (193) ;mRNA; f:5701-6279
MVNGEFELFKFEKHKHEAPLITPNGERVKYRQDGACPRHPDIQLREKKGMLRKKWNQLLPHCPRCQHEWELEIQKNNGNKSQVSARDGENVSETDATAKTGDASAKLDPTATREETSNPEPEPEPVNESPKDIVSLAEVETSIDSAASDIHINTAFSERASIILDAMAQHANEQTSKPSLRRDVTASKFGGI